MLQVAGQKKLEKDDLLRSQHENSPALHSFACRLFFSRRFPVSADSCFD